MQSDKALTINVEAQSITFKPESATYLVKDYMTPIMLYNPLDMSQFNSLTAGQHHNVYQQLVNKFDELIGVHWVPPDSLRITDGSGFALLVNNKSVQFQVGTVVLLSKAMHMMAGRMLISPNVETASLLSSEEREQATKSIIKRFWKEEGILISWEPK